MGRREAELPARRWTPTGWRTSNTSRLVQGWLAALRGDTETAEIMFAAQHEMTGQRGSPGTDSISLLQAFTAAARRQSENAPAPRPRHPGPRRDSGSAPRPCGGRGRCPRAPPANYKAITPPPEELLTMLDSYQPGLAPMLRAERDLSRARLAAATRRPAATSFASAISRLREQSPRTISPTACSTRPSTWPLPRQPGPPVMPGPPGNLGAAGNLEAAAKVPSPRPATSPAACAASPYWTAPTP